MSVLQWKLIRAIFLYHEEQRHVLSHAFLLFLNKTTQCKKDWFAFSDKSNL